MTAHGLPTPQNRQPTPPIELIQTIESHTQGGKMTLTEH
jgi:hypothetical protein